MDALLAKLTMQQQQTYPPNRPMEAEAIVANKPDAEIKAESLSGPAAMTPASKGPSTQEGQAKEEEDMIKVGKAEMLRLKKELEAAKQQLELQKRELDQNRIFSQTVEHALSPSSGEVRASKVIVGNDKAAQIRQQTAIAPSQSGLPRPDLNLFSDNFDNRSAATYNNLLQSQWAAGQPPVNLSPPHQQYQQPMSMWGQTGTATRPFHPRAAGQGVPPTSMLQQQPMPHQRILSGPPSPGTIGDGRFPTDLGQYQAGFGGRRNDSHMPRNDAFGSQQRSNAGNGWGVVGNGIGGLEAMNMGMNSNNAYQTMGMYQPAMSYQPRPIGTPLSATATEFRADEPPANPWNASVSHLPCECPESTHHLHPHRLLPRPVRSTSSLWSPLTTAACWTEASLAIGSTLLTRLCATTTNKHPSSCSRSSRSAQWNRSMRSSKPLLLKPIL